MKLGWLCAEKATAVSLGCAGLMLGDPGLMAGSAVAGAGLVGLWSKARCAEGVNSEKLLADARARLVKDFSSWAEGRAFAEADVIAADKAMERHLADCVPPVDELAKTTFHAEEFPAHAAHLVVERLAEKNPIFSATHPSRSPVAREFALLVMHSALAMAKEQPAFLQRLTQEITLLLPGYAVRIEDAVKAADAGSQARDAEMQALLGISISHTTAIINILQSANVAIHREKPKIPDENGKSIARILQIPKKLTDAILAKKVEKLYKKILDAQNGNRPKTFIRSSLALRKLVDDRNLHGIRLSAKFAQNEACYRLQQNDWESAHRIWSEASLKMWPFSKEESSKIREYAAQELLKFDEKNPGRPLEAAIELLRPLVIST